MTRREMLRLGTLTSAAAIIPGLSGQQPNPPTPKMMASLLEMNGRVMPFPLASVRLLKGDFKRSADINEKYLDSLRVDRLLHSFRVTANITSSAIPYGGWELPTSELRGHFVGGHYLSAVAFAYAGSGNTALRDKGNQVVAGLAACQKANGNGFLSAYPTEFFQRLADGRGVWAPFYTYHKIMAGLIDMYLQTGNGEALEVWERMAGWVSSYFEGISDDQRQRMLRVEYGGMNEVLINLYGITGRERYLALAHKFEQPSILDPLAAGRDELQGLHANTNVPKIIGAARMYEETGDIRYHNIAEYFLNEVLSQRSFAIGNTSDDEHWRTPAGSLTGTLSRKNAECCVAYNLMKLDRHVFSWTGDPRWMDEYERTLWNARLGTQDEEGRKQYFFPLAAGFYRAYGSLEESFWCCTGTGAEDFAKFADTIYFHKGDTVYVNQFIPSVLSWQEQNFTLRQETGFPIDAETQLVIETSRPHERTIAVRIPSWIDEGGMVSVNGEPLEAFAEPGSFLTIRRTWRSGDKVTLKLPMSLREEPLPGDPHTVAAVYGPLVLAGILGEGPGSGPSKIVTGRPTAPSIPDGRRPLPMATAPAGSKTWLTPTAGQPLRFRSQGVGVDAMDVMPMYEVGGQRYSVYWQRS
ncbi:glycoside hydrolase family 127 protein [Edaphobacter sp. HDX4]|uniref:glycoside hydrolase family 127 protein n=1 Tax=Edaphobacter sp. HDX4 TaxID=2794064 RepID=UPI002FE61F20